VAMASTWIPWFRYDDRPLFFFYAICIIPFTVVILAIWLGQILGPAENTRRRRTGAAIVGAAVALVAANFAFIYPILTDQLMTRQAWLARMWLRSWI
ncbi:MAG: dolichyl-phosphate-mannose--protein mannosyltransferase, partial [Acidipropionibacterium jensenii]|nr:dolichyl-phosphate-mannose--protein mannosyltransferase [Acidipropionibacterium jensenii]